MTRGRDRAYLKRPRRDAAALASTRSLAVVIVADQSHDRLASCLASVAEQLPELPVYVYVYCGDEYPGHDELATRYPTVHWVLGSAHLDAGAAINVLVERTPSNTDLLWLTPDAHPVGPLTRTKELIRQPGVAAVFPMTRHHPAASPAPWDTAIRRLTLIRALVAATGYANTLRSTPLSPLYKNQPAESPGINGFTTGACLAISRAAWYAIGGFDEEFLDYGAKIDWQIRAQAAGWRILLADELGVAGGTAVIDMTAASSATTPSQEVCAHEQLRSHDVLRANTALLLEHQASVHHADVYAAATRMLDRRPRARRRARIPQRTGQPAIVIVTNRLVYGGAERQKALLAAELDRRGYPVTIVCLQRFGPLITEIPPTVRVVRQPWWSPSVELPAGPAVVISGDTNTETGFATLWRAAAAGRRWLVAPHTPPQEDRPIYSRALVAAMSRADGFIALAQRHWEMLVAQHRLGGRYFLAPNGVAVADQQTPQIRSAGDAVRLVMLSRIVEHKNPHLLIAALSDLTQLPWTLSIFGDGPDREKLQARTPASVRDRVRWRGWCADPRVALAEADVLCIPSRSEAFPLAILEAMSLAVPVAASAICAVPEMLDFGKAGFLVEPVSRAAWRECLAGILADPAGLPSVGLRGHERMRKYYTVETMTDAYLEAISAVV
ncbi:MAG: glycosyltransferase [Mycobacteriaceae bacterium]|nr:glycosyltransferase [Mycobacteriaceae bacterium]